VSQPERVNSGPVTIGVVSDCTEPKHEYDPATGGLKRCDPATDDPSVASEMGLRPGDVITEFNGEPVDGWSALTARVRDAANETVTVTVQRGSETITATGQLPEVLRLRQDVIASDRPLSSITDEDLEPVGVLGISPQTPVGVYGPARAFSLTGTTTVDIFTGTFEAIKRLPEKIPKLWAALTGEPRDPETPISVVGASIIGGELFEAGELPMFLMLLAILNFFVGVFNLFPLLPLDGGHIAIAWFEKVRSWLYARLGRPDPGRVDYLKLMPLTYVVILIFGGFTLLTVAADIVNPISLIP
jgi:membrane-associated protease RseP (regulator of RpoE activity)